ncbi:MAG: hypothetical protein K1X83_09925 [Oligoflexia bacterium]|nr:hypothetical protein [Oligoflexia bacterium]
MGRFPTRLLLSIFCVLNILRYYSQLLKHPQLRDFIQMGFGIEARHQRCSDYWARHLDLCRDFVRTSILEDQLHESVAVLGAGRLLDIDLPFLMRQFGKVDLYDADPSVLRSWDSWNQLEREGRSFGRHVVDLSGNLAEWTSLLGNYLRHHRRSGPAGLCNLLEELPCCPADDKFAPAEVLLSVNLLSQLSLYWRDRVQKLLESEWGLVSDNAGRFEPGLQQALESSMRKLEEQHLRQLASRGARLIILITDEELHYYHASHSQWSTFPALRIDAEIKLPGYQVDQENSWLWHIAPQGIEESAYGVIHQVRGRAFTAQSENSKLGFNL